MEAGWGESMLTIVVQPARRHWDTQPRTQWNTWKIPRGVVAGGSWWNLGRGSVRDRDRRLWAVIK